MIIVVNQFFKKKGVKKGNKQVSELIFLKTLRWLRKVSQVTPLYTTALNLSYNKNKLYNILDY